MWAFHATIPIVSIGRMLWPQSSNVTCKDRHRTDERTELSLLIVPLLELNLLIFLKIILRQSTDRVPCSDEQQSTEQPVAGRGDSTAAWLCTVPPPDGQTHTTRIVRYTTRSIVRSIFGVSHRYARNCRAALYRRPLHGDLHTCSEQYAAFIERNATQRSASPIYTVNNRVVFYDRVPLSHCKYAMLLTSKSCHFVNTRLFSL